MSDAELKITEVIVTKVKAEPGETLFFTFNKDEVSVESIKRIDGYLKTAFPNNRVIVGTLNFEIKQISH